MNTNFDKLFEQDFDIAEPTIDHFERFEKRISNPQKIKSNNWKWISIAASIILLFGVWFGGNFRNDKLELADISPKMEETQDYFTSLIRIEIEKINIERNDENGKLINDSFTRLEKLEKQYSKLTVELKESDEDKRVIFAMISNYQQRIEILQNLLEQIDNIKQLKSNEYENIS